MADDTSLKPNAPQSNIDDLVKELSRPQVPASTVPQPSGPSSMPSMPPRPTPPPVSNPGTPPAAPKPTSAPVAPTAPKEYQSSIRTMTDDLSKLKSGQQPQGVNIPRKIDAQPAPAPKPTVPAPPPVPVKPAPSSMMPPSVKSSPLPSFPKPAPTPAPVPAPVKPAQMSPMAMPPQKAPEKPESQFYTPSAKTGYSGNRTMLFAGIAVLAVILGGVYWFLMIRNSADVSETPIETFTPRPTATPVQDVLGAVFPTEGGAIYLPASGDVSGSFNIPVNPPGTFVAIDVMGGPSSASSEALTITGLFDRFGVSYPPELKTALGQNSKFLLYGQKESFDAKGKPITGGTPGSSRVVLISEIASSSASILQAWESTMSTDLANLMAITPAKNKGAFQTTSYQGTSIRFKNFPYPDRSIDYALLQQNTKTYLILASSRESMFAALDAFDVMGK